MKRTLSLVLALVMVLGSFGTVFAVDSADKVEVGAFLEAAGVLQGDMEGNLMLDNTLLRRDMVVLLSRLMGVEDLAMDFPSESLTFKDITDDFYNGYIAWSVENGLIEGHSEDLFGFNENVTAQQYARVLLRALGHSDTDVPYAAVLKTAKDLGIFGELEVENDDQITRGHMSIMTFNALSTPMKDSETTLAESIGIEMPVPVVTEATKVENVYADNLVEIVVVFDGEVDKDSAELEVNYSLNKDLEIDKVKLSDDMTQAVLTLKLNKIMGNQKEYELTVRNIKTAEGKLNTEKIKFTPVDRAIPEVAMVEGLGDKAVKVTFSEPVKDSTVKTSNFKIDGKTVVGTIDKDNSNVVILKLYKKLSEGTHTLEVKGVEDFAGYLMVPTEMEFEAIEDNEAPTIESVNATLEYVTVTFSEPVQESTVRGSNYGYWKSTESTSTKNKSAFKVEKISDTTYKFDFSASGVSLPGYSVYLYVEGVKDFSDNTIAKDSPVLVNAVIDQTRPEVVSVKVNDANTEITVKFTKDLSLKSVKDKDNYKLLDKDDKKVSFKTPVFGDNNKTVKIGLFTALKKGNHTLELEGLKDRTVLENTILPYSATIEVGSADGPTAGVKGDAVGVNGEPLNGVQTFSLNGRDALVKFNRKMTIGGEFGVDNPNNYIIGYSKVTVEKDDEGKDKAPTFGNVKTIALPDDAEISVFADGKSVVIRMPEEIDDKVVGLADGNVTIREITVQKVEDEDGKTLQGYSQKLYVATIGFKITKATLKESKKIEVELNQVVVGEYTDMTINVPGNSAIKVDYQDVQDDKVILTLNKDLYGTENVTIKALANSFELSGGSKNAEDTFGNIKDEVKPELDEDNEAYPDGLKVDGMKIEVLFTEEISTKNASVFNGQFEITRIATMGRDEDGNDKEVKEEKLVPGTEFEVNRSLDNKNILIITLESGAFTDKDGNVAATANFIVKLKDNNYITDLGNNSAVPFEVTSPEVTGMI